MITNEKAAALVEGALKEGRTLTTRCPNGDTLTAGRAFHATGEAPFQVIRWGRSRFAEPCGKVLETSNVAAFVAWTFVQNCGRGAARVAVEGR